MPDRAKKRRFIIDYVLTTDSWKLRRVKKHRVDVMTYSQVGLIDAGLTKPYQRRENFEKTKSNKSL